LALLRVYCRAAAACIARFQAIAALWRLIIVAASLIRPLLLLLLMLLLVAAVASRS
jgi:hypothetical protein